MKNAPRNPDAITKANAAKARKGKPKQGYSKADNSNPDVVFG